MKNIKVYKEKKTGYIIIVFDEQKLVFKNNHFYGHCSDINKKQYFVDYEKGNCLFYHKKKLIVSVPYGKFLQMKSI